MERLEELRNRLDATDRHLLEVLVQRLEIVRQVADLKADALSFLRDSGREQRLLDRVEEIARELELDPYRSREIFREIIAMSLKVQEEALLNRQRRERSRLAAHRVAYQGIEGSYSHMAARKFFAARSAGMELVGCRSFEAALGMAEEGEAGFAILPIENTTAGSINETYELLRRTPLAIVGEEIFPVRHCLLAISQVEPASLNRIISHPQALAQCSRFLRSLPGTEATAWGDTASAARHVSEAADPSLAAIASEEAANLYGLTVLSRDIADQEANWTRFVIVSAPDEPPDPRIPSKTSLVLTTRHDQGALARVLEIVAGHGLNLCKLESRPEPSRPWEYMFYMDIEGSLAADAVSMTIARIRRECPYLKVLGSYPARTTGEALRDRPTEGA
ncbi:MAG TPA: prephenate dehydratase [Acidobacteria bacterium]|nr:prephenate dehydratase [Acidobacteriota bacterium]